MDFDPVKEVSELRRDIGRMGQRMSALSEELCEEREARLELEREFEDYVRESRFMRAFASGAVSMSILMSWVALVFAFGQ